MSGGADRVEHRDLGVDDVGRGAEAVLYSDGDVTIQHTNRCGGIVLDPEQQRALCGFLVNRVGVDE